MRLDELHVKNTRNIEEVSLVPDAELTVVAGGNGQGKTSLLESIFLLTGSKSFRGAKDKELVRRGCEQGQLVGVAECGGRQNRIEVCVESGNSGRRGRSAKVNGVNYGRAAEIAGIFTAVVFEPGHLSLIKSGPEGRRRFLDAALCQLYPGYVGILRRFARALAQKNALLRRYHETKDAAALLDAFDAELSAAGAEMIRRRAAYLERAAPAAEGFYAEVAAGAEELRVQYQPCAPPDALAEGYRGSRAADIRAGFSTFGPQREDFGVSLSGESARIYASQGQQRSAVLSLKLAEAAVAKQVSGEHPVLLLDDVLSELDEGRQAYLLSRMGGRQSFVTCCEPAVFKRTAGKIVWIESGKILAVK